MEIIESVHRWGLFVSGSAIAFSTPLHKTFTRKEARALALTLYQQGKPKYSVRKLSTLSKPGPR